MALQKSKSEETSQTTTYKPDAGQMAEYNRARHGMAGAFWDENGQFQTPYYGGPAGGIARSMGLQPQDLMAGQYGDQLRGVTDQAGLGYRDPSSIGYQSGYQPQQFQVGGLDYRDPFQGYAGGAPNRVAGPERVSTNFEVPWERVEAERVSGTGQMSQISRGGIREVSAPELQQYQMAEAERVRGPGAVERVGGLPQISAPAIERYQMGTAPEVQAGGLRDLSMQAAGPVSAGTVSTESFTRPGTAQQFMDPYMQAVVDVNKTAPFRTTSSRCRGSARRPRARGPTAGAGRPSRNPPAGAICRTAWRRSRRPAASRPGSKL